MIVRGVRQRNSGAVTALLIALCALLFGACRNQGTGEATRTASKNDLELVFPYGSEKEGWIKEVTDLFNDSEHKTKSGKPIFVRAIPMGSGETIDEVLSRRLEAHIASPASAAFIELGNAQSRTKTGHDLIGSTENLVLSPVVIAMWKPMAEAIGWGKKPVGWSDILALARSDKGWQAYGYPQWGRFKFGHTHPEYSNSGLISLFAEVYAATGKRAGLKMSDLDQPKVRDFLSGVEQSVVHYGSSTGFFGRKMFTSGPEYLSAAVLYESMVVESYSNKDMPFPVVAIYPKEGTFWSDHPVGVIDRPWVTPEHQEAAKIYIQYLLERPQQEKALKYGFRPAAPEVPLADPIDAAHGVDPKEPKTTLEVPSVEVMNGILKLWELTKKHSDVVLVLDTSGSMEEEGKMQNAKEGARQLIQLLGDDDTFSLLPFNSQSYWLVQDTALKDGRQPALDKVNSLFPSGGTALYDSIGLASQHFSGRPADNRRIDAIVVLTDGADTESKATLDQLLSSIRYNGETRPVHVFTIAYGDGAKKDVLQNIADATQGKSYDGTPKNIVSVFRDISTFF